MYMMLKRTRTLIGLNERPSIKFTKTVLYKTVKTSSDEREKNGLPHNLKILISEISSGKKVFICYKLESQND